MRKRNVRYVNRSFHRKSDRKLTMQELLVLDFLWTWKTASTAMLKEVAYRDKTYWWAYKALRRLKQEKYIQLLPRGKNLDLEVWALTRNGFEVVLMDRDDMEQYRYRVHAPAHDYLATCLQLGDLWQSGIDAQFFTEQQLASLAPWNFPQALRSETEHIPDGITLINGKLHDVIIGYEVDINLKHEERYESTLKYYQDGVKPNLVVWLVKNKWMAQKILGVLKRRTYARDQDEIIKRYVFVLLDDFKKSVWDAIPLNGNYKDTTVRKLHANLLQNIGKDVAKLGQKSMKNIFFPKFKSPQKSCTSIKIEVLENLLTPFGSRGEL